MVLGAAAGGGEGTARRRRFAASRANSCGGEVQLGEAVATAASAGSGTAGVDGEVRRPAAGRSC